MSSQVSKPTAASATAAALEQLPLLAAAPVPAANHQAVVGLVQAILAGAVSDFRSPAATAKAMTTADICSRLTRLGRIALVRPGLGNIMFSPAQLYLLARHFDVVVLMYTNMHDAGGGPTELRRLYEVEGVPVPPGPASQARIYAIGSPRPTLLSFEQQSDVSLRQLSTLQQHAETLGAEVLRDHPWVFAHSQGVNDMVLTDQRLRRAGLPGLERLVAIGAAVLGGRLMGNPVLRESYAASAAAAAGEQGRQAVEALRPSATIATLARHLRLAAAPLPDQKRALMAELSRRIFAAYGGVVNREAPRGDIRDAFWGSDSAPEATSLALIPDEHGTVMPNDGAEDVESTTLGRINRALHQVDHILCIEDPQVLAGILSELQPYATH